MGSKITLEGVVQFLPFGTGSKSEGLRPYLVQDDGTKILLFKKQDNPFENRGLSGYQNQRVKVQGENINNCLHLEVVCPVISDGESS